MTQIANWRNWAGTKRFAGVSRSGQHHSMLVILQGMDTSGKDGTIRHVLAHVNPQGCLVHSFKEPTPEELAHDFSVASA